MPKIVDKELRRKEMVQAAARVFAEKGYNHARMSDIAEELGVSKGLIYEYFDSKETIFVEVCKNIVPWHSLPDGDLKPSLPLLERVIRDIDASYEEAKDFFLIMSDFWTAALRGPVDQKEVMLSQGPSFYREPRGLLVSFIRSGQNLGAFNRDVKPVPLANMILATIEGIRMQSVLDPRNAQKEATLRLLLAVVKARLAVD